MEAKFFIGPIVNVTLSKVVSLATEQIKLGVGYKKELVSFRATLSMIEGLLFHAEQKEATGAPGVKTWLEELQKIADEADAVMDEIAYESLRRKVERKQVSGFFSSSNRVAVRMRMAYKIKKLNAALVVLNNRATGLGFQHILANDPGHRDLVQQTDSLLGDPSRVVGRETDAQNIVNLLTESGNDHSLGVVSIMGVGGLGKTTLAKLVCNNDRIRGNFFKIIWVCVSEKFDVLSILAEMLQSLTRGPSIDRTNQDTVVRMIKERLEENNFLLVLDDVWSENKQKWRDLRNCLLGVTRDVGRSKVLVTTRLAGVPSIMRSVPGNIEQLKDHECWSIIKQQAFGNVSPVPPELKAIGEKIAIKCRGVPLVANAIGGALHNNRNEDEWLSIEKNFDATDDAGVLRALKLSFDRLPRPALKQCFLYCSIFSKDFVMEKDMLIQLWMAQGFLSGLDSSVEMEDVGDNYLKDLVSCSFFQDVVRDSYGSIISCKMHDLMYDLAKSISKSEVLVLEEDNNHSDFGDIRHLNLLCAPSMAPTETVKVFQKLHSLFLGVDIVFDRSVNFRKLLALSFHGADIFELPSFLGKLKRLRYLDVSETEITELPKFISKFYLLQTFRFVDCVCLEKPLEGIENLVSLKHICFNKTKHMPAGIGSLTCLQTLELFVVGHQRGYQIQELEHLSQLRGKLKICNLENIRNEEEARRANLSRKTALVELRLEFGLDPRLDECENQYDVLENLKPHPNLKSLSLSHYGGKTFPSWMSDSIAELNCLGNLLRLELHDCPGLENISSLSLSNKATLEIRRCRNLKSFAGSSLQVLIIEYCDELVSLQFGQLATASLKEISIKRCNKLKGLPIMSSLSSLEILSLDGCSKLKSIGESLSPCISLRDLNIRSCYALRSVPCMDGLLSLERIHIYRCKHLKTIEGKSFSSSKYLKHLSLTFCAALMSIPSLDGLVSLEIIDFLRCPQLKSIEGTRLSSSTSLRKFSLSNCHALTSIPSIHGLSSLQELVIDDCPHLENIGVEVNGKYLLSFTCLQELRISYFPALTSVPSLRGLFSLEKIRIFGFEQWQSFEENFCFPTRLKELEICDCPALTSIPSLDGLFYLKEIEIANCPQLKSIAGKSLSSSTNLRKLVLWNCHALISLPSIQDVSSLESLYICHCGSLTRLPDGMSSIHSLHELALGGFSSALEEVSVLNFIQQLHGSLESLTLVGWEKLKHLPPQIQFLTALTRLCIKDFDELEALPDFLGKLSSIEDLTIENCSSLIHMPSKEAMQGLSSLQFLSISNCPELEARYTRRSGPEWEKISHIPHIDILSKQDNIS